MFLSQFLPTMSISNPSFCWPPSPNISAKKKPVLLIRNQELLVENCWFKRIRIHQLVWTDLPFAAGAIPPFVGYPVANSHMEKPMAFCEKSSGGFSIYMSACQRLKHRTLWSTRKMATSVKATCESMAALPSGKHTKNYGKSPNIERITDLWGLVKSPWCYVYIYVYIYKWIYEINK